jgi:hypothetical protein
LLSFEIVLSVISFVSFAVKKNAAFIAFVIQKNFKNDITTTKKLPGNHRFQKRDCVHR